MKPFEQAIEEASTEYARELTRDRSYFDGNDERIALAAHRKGVRAGIKLALESKEVSGLYNGCEYPWARERFDHLLKEIKE